MNANAIQTSNQPVMIVRRTISNGGSYMDGWKELAANGERYPTIMEFNKRTLGMGRTPYSELSADDQKILYARPGWSSTNCTVPHIDRSLPKGVDITDSYNPRLILLAEYSKKAGQIANDKGFDLYSTKNAGIVYNVASVEEPVSGKYAGKIIFHPHEIFVQTFLSESGFGKLNLETYVAGPLPIEELEKVAGPLSGHGYARIYQWLAWELQSEFGRSYLITNRPLSGRNESDNNGSRTGVASIFPNYHGDIDECYGWVAVKISTQAQITPAPDNNALHIKE